MMVKRATHIVLAIVLLVSTAGVTVSRHYCGNNLKSVSLMTVPDFCCDTQECCHNETDVYQVDDDFALSAFIIDFEQVITLTPVIIALNSFEIASSYIKNIYSDRPSPPGIRLFLATLQTYLL